MSLFCLRYRPDVSPEKSCFTHEAEASLIKLSRGPFSNLSTVNDSRFKFVMTNIVYWAVKKLQICNDTPARYVVGINLKIVLQYVTQNVEVGSY